MMPILQNVLTTVVLSLYDCDLTSLSPDHQRELLQTCSCTCWMVPGILVPCLSSSAGFTLHWVLLMIVSVSLITAPASTLASEVTSSVQTVQSTMNFSWNILDISVTVTCMNHCMTVVTEFADFTDWCCELVCEWVCDGGEYVNIELDWCSRCLGTTPQSAAVTGPLTGLTWLHSPCIGGILGWKDDAVHPLYTQLLHSISQLSYVAGCSNA